MYFKVTTVGTYINSGLSTVYGSFTVSLNGTSTYTIPSSVTIGDPFDITIDSPTNKQHILSWNINSGAATGQTTIAANTANPVSVTIPMNTLNSLTTGTSFSVEYRLQTSSAGTVIRNGTVTVPASAKPSFPSAAKPSVQPTTTGTILDQWGIYVAGISKAVVTQANTGAPAISYSAAIKSYKITGNGCNATGTSLPLTATSSTLTSGSKVFTVTATDSRGRTGSINSDTITVLAYSDPYVSNPKAIRCLANGTADDDGTYIKATATPNCTSLGGRNTVSVTVSYRIAGGDTWYTAGTLNDQNTLVFHSDSSSAHVITVSNNYEVRFTVTDTVGRSASSIVIVPRSLWEMHVKKGGGAWAFGGVADQEGTLKVYGQVAAALGNVPTAVCNIGGDLNNAIMPGLYTYSYTYSHSPTSSAGGTLLVTKHGSYIFQLAFADNASNNANMYSRINYSGTWGDWVRLTTSALYPYQRSDLLNTTASVATTNAWVDTGLTADLTAGHLYAIAASVGSGGSVYGIQLRAGSTINFEHEVGSGQSMANLNPVFYCNATNTYKVFVKRAGTGSASYRITDIGNTQA